MTDTARRDDTPGTDDPRLYFNGVTEEGGYVQPPLPPEEWGERLAAVPPDWHLRAEPDPRGVEDPTRAPRYGVDPEKLEEAGWAVVWAPGLDPRVRRALDPLCDLRHEQAGELFQEIVYRPGEDLNTFLGRLGAPPGVADPSRLPYYVLLVGDPAEIPFSFQTALDQVYAVGRLHFDAPQDYAAYARSVVNAEERRRGRRGREIAFFAPVHDGDPATERTCRDLVMPLADHVEEARPAWGSRRYLRGEAGKARLRGLLGGGETPAVLVAGCHGLQVTTGGDERQRARQGALITADWPGGKNTPVAEAHTLAAADLGDDADASGLVAFVYACYGLGTPQQDSFHLAAGGPPRIAERPFISALAKRLLSLPGGGALAMIGHVDRAWTTSFDWGNRGDVTEAGQGAVLESLLEMLLDGQPAGAATEYLGQLNGDLGHRLSSEWEEQHRSHSLDHPRLGHLRTVQKDVELLTLFGDPAVRLVA